MVYKLIKGATLEEIRSRAGLGGYYRIRGSTSVTPMVSWTAAYINTMGDPIADIHEDMAAEEKA